MVGVRGGIVWLVQAILVHDDKGWGFRKSQILQDAIYGNPDTNGKQHAATVENWESWWGFGQHAAAAIFTPSHGVLAQHTQGY